VDLRNQVPCGIELFVDDEVVHLVLAEVFLLLRLLRPALLLDLFLLTLVCGEKM
jgi:hypothetical protein